MKAAVPSGESSSTKMISHSIQVSTIETINQESNVSRSLNVGTTMVSSAGRADKHTGNSISNPAPPTGRYRPGHFARIKNSIAQRHAAIKIPYVQDRWRPMRVDEQRRNASGFRARLLKDAA
jgi:hypothetical protein